MGMKQSEGQIPASGAKGHGTLLPVQFASVVSWRVASPKVDGANLRHDSRARIDGASICMEVCAAKQHMYVHACMTRAWARVHELTSTLPPERNILARITVCAHQQQGHELTSTSPPRAMPRKKRERSPRRPRAWTSASEARISGTRCCFHSCASMPRWSMTFASLGVTIITTASFLDGSPPPTSLAYS